MFGLGNQQPQQQSQLGNIASRQIHNPSVPEQVIKWRMDTIPELEEIENRMLGKVKVDGVWVEGPDGFKVCNEKGVSLARIWYTTLVNKVTLQGNMTEDEVEEQLLVHADTITEHVGKKYEDYGIDESMRDTFVELVIGMLRIALTRPIEDKERDHAVAQSSERTTTNQVQSVRDIMPHYGQGYRM